MSRINITQPPPSLLSLCVRGMILPLVWMLSNGCSNTSSDPCTLNPDIISAPTSLHLEQFQDSMIQLQSKQAVIHFFSRHVTLGTLFFNRRAYPNDDVFAKELSLRFANPSIDTLLQETKRVFGDLSRLKKELADAFSYMRHYYPDFTVPKVQTVITGLENDLYVSDTLIIIGLDFFLGSGAKYRPNVYRYILRRYRQDFIVPSIMLLFGINERYNKSDEQDRTVLADMVAYGKAYYFAKQMMPCVPDSIFIGYSAEEMAGSRRYRHLIWKRLIDDEVLYSTSHLVKQKYIAERPKTLEVGEKCPGRIATWVGWEITKAYMQEHPKTTLPELMQKSDAESLLKQSAYKPD